MPLSGDADLHQTIAIARWCFNAYTFHSTDDGVHLCSVLNDMASLRSLPQWHPVMRLTTAEQHGGPRATETTQPQIYAPPPNHLIFLGHSSLLQQLRSWSDSSTKQGEHMQSPVDHPPTTFQSFTSSWALCPGGMPSLQANLSRKDCPCNNTA